MILFIESAAHKIFGGNGHSHFSESQVPGDSVTCGKTFRGGW